MGPITHTRRKAIALAVEVRIPSEQRAFAALAGELTHEGVFVSTFHGVARGTLVAIELALAGGPLVVHGEVSEQRSNAGGAAGFVVRFGALGDDARARLNEAVGATSRRKVG